MIIRDSATQHLPVEQPALHNSLPRSLLPFLHQFPIEVLQDVEGLLPFTPAGDQPLAVIEILNARQRSSRRTTICQDPGVTSRKDGSFRIVAIWCS